MAHSKYVQTDSLLLGRTNYKLYYHELSVEKVICAILDPTKSSQWDFWAFTYENAPSPNSAFPILTKLHI